MTGSPNEFWSNEAVLSRFRELVEAGLAYSEIARTMNAEFHHGLTRNACIGKARRMGLWNGRDNFGATKIRAHRQAGGKRASRPRQRRLTEIAVAKKAPPAPVSATPFEPAPELYPHACDLLHLTNETCRWPLGDDNPLYCGNPTADLAERRPYCHGHHLIAHYRY